MALASAACAEQTATPQDRSQAGKLQCDPSDSKPALGLMTSLPLIWPLGAEFTAIARGEVAHPWQYEAMAECFAVTPLDTLSLIEGVDPAAPAIDPLSDFDRLAVIQPRGLSPADNAALDEWVRKGGRLLLVLDPMLTGHYDLPLGDPRRPVDTALVAPVVKRWGLNIGYGLYEVWDDGFLEASYPGGTLDLAHPGIIEIVDEEAARCEVHARMAMARCSIGKGQITLLADAGVFESDSDHDHGPDEGEIESAKAASLIALMQFAFSRQSPMD